MMTLGPIRSWRLGLWLLSGLLGWANLAPRPLAAQETADYFKRSCANCHTIGGGRLVGPDLKNVEQRKDRAWLTRFMLNPKAIIDGGDSYAQQLLQEYRNVLMPATPDLTPDRAESILKLIEGESKLERSQFAGGAAQIPDRPFTAEEIEQGRQHFIGLKPFVKGGAACFSCHSVQHVSALGGGMLGPDLTLVFNKLQGRKGLAAWLSSPPTPAMQSIYKNHPLANEEIVLLIAYLEKAKEGREELSVARLNFFLLGLAGAAGGFVVFDYLWKRRLQTVRRELVHGKAAIRKGDRTF